MFPRHPRSTASSEFRGSTTTLRDAAGAEGGGVLTWSRFNSLLVVIVSSISSSKKSRFSPKLMVEDSILVSVISGKLVAKSMMKS